MALKKEWLSVPTQPDLQNSPGIGDVTLAVDATKGEVKLDFATTAVDVDSEAYRHLQEEGLNPDEWEVVTARTSRWTLPNGDEGRSARYTFRQRLSGAYNVEEVLSWLDGYESPREILPWPDSPGLIFAIGDSQYGKADGDGVDGTLKRAIAYIDTAAGRVAYEIEQGMVSHVVVAFMGDHGEGFVSQNGANVFRTTLTNTEQQRLVRRTMTYAVKKFAEVVPENVKLSFLAVPGNHGDTIRFNGKGTTRYDDSYDTEALVAVAEAVELSENPALKRIEFYVPQNDEIAVTLDIAGTRAVFAHGHFHKPGKALDWLAGQAFDKGSPMRDADLLVEGHLHHFHVDTRNGVTFVGVPAVESESTWFRHRTGITGDPGAVLIQTRGGEVPAIEVIR